MGAFTNETSIMSIPASKADYKLCGACFCSATYITEIETCCGGFSTCCCFTNESYCCGTPDESNAPNAVPAGTCGICCPGLIITPQFGCCKKLGDLTEGGMEKAKTLYGDRAEYTVCGACCLGPLHQQVTCCHGPKCCRSLRRCLCIMDECAFPCDDEIPFALGCPYLPGCICYPGCGCCPKVGDMFSDKMEKGEPAATGSGPPPMNAA